MSVARTAISLAPIVVLARGLGFFVPVLIAHLFGVSLATDAFFYALAWPMLALVVTGNAVGTVITPILARIQAQDPQTLGPFVVRVLLGTASVNLIGGLLLWAALPSLLPLLPGFRPELVAPASRFVGLLLPFMLGVTSVILLRAVSEIRGLFRLAAGAPVPRATLTVVALLVLHRPLGTDALPTALALGVLCELAWYVAILYRDGLRPWGLLPAEESLGLAFLSVLPVLIGQACAASALVVDRTFAGTLPEGAVSILDYADRLRLVPQTLLDGTLLPVAFATWSHQLAAGDRDGFARQLDRSLRWIAGVAGPGLAALYVGRAIGFRWLFERGAFTAEDTQAAASVFGWYVPGLWWMMLGALCMRAHIAEGRRLPVMWIGALGLGVKVALDAALVVPWGVEGLALASTGMYVCVATAYLYSARRTWLAVASASQWLRPLALSVGSFAIAVVLEITGTPISAWDPRLWSALAGLTLLAWWGRR